ncbi:MAG: aminoacyl-tRNA hydrolase [Bacilli bacterium]|jgi:PTH2 family peptidyl-tRNA hydrolase
MAIVVRKDLEMSVGKLAGQCGHAVAGCLRKPVSHEVKDFFDCIITDWFEEGQVKVILQVETEKDLQMITSKCLLNEVPYYCVRDFGLTELEPNTLTCIGIGPDIRENINKITGNLKLYK